MVYLADLPLQKRDLKRRIGHFTIDLSIIQNDPDIARMVLEGCVVLRAECILHTAIIDYIALHEDFDEVPEGNIALDYECRITLHQDFSRTREWVKRT